MTIPSTSQPAHTNRLIKATSPYLQQHSHNPVDWYEWGPEALEKAKREDKPIFLSIGYSACHWCHVMAHESFENEDIAAVMNKHFVNIKVDREERPDLDEIYMQATILYSGSGGWPMSVWLTPDLKPFAAGTYFPPTAKWGRIGFKEICEQIGDLWKARRADIEGDASRIADAVKARLTTAASQPAASSSPSATSRPAANIAFSLEIIDRVAAMLAGAFDGAKGGLRGGGTNKFPPSMAMDLLLRSAQRHRLESNRASGRFVELVRLTLDKMATGGIYDQLGGGIARYSTDEDWLVPHFEKMLYDQALVSRIYLDAYQYTGDKLYARIAGEIFDYVIGDLQSPEGGFYSTRDADSEGEEGKYYVWTKAEVLQILGKEDGEPFCGYYDVSETGNWDDPHAPGVPKNILHVPRDLATVAKLNNVAPEELEKRLAAARKKMLEARSKRVPPHRDEKILCEWNGLMIASMARGGCVLGEKRFIDAAAKAANFILEKQYKNGRLLRSYRDGRTLDTAFLSDYAAMIEGLLELYEATFEKRWLDKALELNNAVIKNYWDEKDGGFFVTAHDHETLLARSKDITDSAVPSGNSVQLSNLLRLSVMLGDEKWRAMAEQMMTRFTADVLESPGAAERFLSGVEFALAGPVEIAVIGDPADARTQALLKKIHATYLPNRVILLENPALVAKQPAEKIKSPLLEGRALVDGKPAAYVCRNYACKLPATTAEELEKQLK